MAKQIPLSDGSMTTVDDADHERLLRWRWHMGTTGHAVRWEGAKGSRKAVYMHRAIVDAPVGMMVDHIDGDSLNNQRGNLRLATNAENQRNQKPRAGGSSQYKGVYWAKGRSKWCAQIEVNGKTTFLGYFTDEVEAARAYDRAARQYFGEFARLNFSDQNEEAA